LRGKVANLKQELSALAAAMGVKRRKLPKPPHRQLVNRIAKQLIGPMLKNKAKVFERRDRRGKLVAAMLFEPGEKRRHATFFLLSLPGDPDSRRWLAETLQIQKPLLGRRCEGNLELWQRNLLPWFARQGFAVRAVYLEGEVEKSLRRLRRHYGKELRAPLDEAGGSIRAAKSVKEFSPYLEILRKEYGRNPQFGHFVSNKKFLTDLHKFHAGMLRRGKKSLWLVHGRDRLFGGSDVFQFPGTKRAGFGVNLSAMAQGKHFARALYETVLLELRARGVTHYEGSTGQPGVMRLGKVMGRRLVMIKVDRGFAKPFPPGHFKSWL
jgi:hypothetical protein